MRRLPSIIYPILLLSAVTAIGVAGYMSIEGFGFLDALYMTVITVSTVGYGEVHPLSEGGRLFTIGLLIASFGTFAYALTEVSRYLIDGGLRNYLDRIRLDKDIGKLSGHTIVCGYGRNGRQSAITLADNSIPFVVIEKDRERIVDLERNGRFFIDGDATHDDVLKRAGIATAKALITTLPTDADNLYVVLSARVLRPDLLIISRASDEGADRKLRHAGADNVIMPDRVGGAHMAQLVVQPDLMEFIDALKVRTGDQVMLDEVTSSVRIRIGQMTEGGVNCIGLKLPDGQMIYNPDPHTMVQPGTKFFVLGTRAQVRALEKRVSV